MRWSRAGILKTSYRQPWFPPLQRTQERGTHLSEWEWLRAEKDGPPALRYFPRWGTILSYCRKSTPKTATFQYRHKARFGTQLIPFVIEKKCHVYIAILYRQFERLKGSVRLS